MLALEDCVLSAQVHEMIGVPRRLPFVLVDFGPISDTWRGERSQQEAMNSEEGSSRRSWRHFPDWTAWFCLEIFANMTD